MDRRKLTLKVKKLSASSVLEVVIAMVIIIVVFGITMMLYANVTKSVLSVQQLRAQAILKELFTEKSNANDFSNNTFVIQDISVTQTTENFKTDNDLVIVKLEAFDLNNKSLATISKVMMRSNEK